MENKLFTPYQLGPITLRNRFIRSAAFENMCKDNKATQQLEDYHVSVARGGVGMTTVAYCAVEQSGVSFDGQLVVCEETKPSLKHLVAAVHAEGAKASIQLGHCGNMTHWRTCHCMPMSASTGINLYSPCIHRGISKEEIRHIVKKFGEAVDFCRECGFDCVEIHCGHAYLISQFISRRTNHRHDEYGGSFENRVRFMNEVLDEVMLHAKDDMAVVVKMNMTDDCIFGTDLNEGILVAKEIVKHGVHGIVLSAGTVSASPMTVLGGYMPFRTFTHYMPMKLWYMKALVTCGGPFMVPGVPFKELYFMDWAKRFQREITGTTLIYVGGVQSGTNCQTIMEEGFELFQIAHVLIKDPDFVKHVADDLGYHAGCGRSNYCIGRMYTLDMKCHHCVLRDGEPIPASLQREIARLEKKAQKSIAEQYATKQ